MGDRESEKSVCPSAGSVMKGVGVLRLQIGGKLGAQCVKMRGTGKMTTGSEDRNSLVAKRWLLVHNISRLEQGLLRSILSLSHMFLDSSPPSRSGIVPTSCRSLLVPGPALCRLSVSMLPAKEGLSFLSPSGTLLCPLGDCHA